MRSRSYFCILFSLLALVACSSNNKHPVNLKADTLPLPRSGVNKPGSSFQDTLKVNMLAAVFFSPDSLQLQKLKQQVDKGVLEANLHEYDNQFRVSHIELKDNWKNVRVFDTYQYRYLQFLRKDGRMITIDLDKKGEPCGLFAFDPQKDPQYIDMMNVGTQLYYYFHQ